MFGPETTAVAFPREDTIRRLRWSVPLLMISQLLFLRQGVGIEIRKLNVPRVIESGKHPHVILECEFHLTHQEVDQVDIKWFFNGDPQPFYQWLPGRKPQSIGTLFQNRLDLSYSTTDRERHHTSSHLKPNIRFRALKILNPTSELSGIYKCKVSSLLDEDFMQKQMLVYTPPRYVEVIHQINNNKLNVTCSTSGAFPTPQLTLYLTSDSKPHEHSLSSSRNVNDGRDTVILAKSEAQDEKSIISLTSHSLYGSDALRTKTSQLTPSDVVRNVTIHRVIEEFDLSVPLYFTCLVRLTGTGYKTKKKAVYYPDKVLTQKSSSLLMTSRSNSIHFNNWFCWCANQSSTRRGEITALILTKSRWKAIFYSFLCGASFIILYTNVYTYRNVYYD